MNHETYLNFLRDRLGGVSRPVLYSRTDCTDKSSPTSQEYGQGLTVLLWQCLSSDVHRTFEHATVFEQHFVTARALRSSSMHHAHRNANHKEKRNAPQATNRACIDISLGASARTNTPRYHLSETYLIDLTCY